ncbi:hypothetical protein EX895_002457 [Sporisorium graminicola]|uniref:Uncharacterized protein n=1 Tax=Sporisorium graminicola TaxID=280036 RepID=A0A4V6YEP4_9BASI|nr:hypothetical protein EX895_002457 [Sporisorium graminicola]TKY88469.1 hypothetical protein EX895_002457 [Sporisorium graminicola]
MVQLHHSFLFAALGIASAASAFAVASGGEHASYLARRFVDNHAQALFPRDQDRPGEGQLDQGHPVSEPFPSAGQNSGDGGGGNYDPKHRLSTSPRNDRSSISEAKQQLESTLLPEWDRQLTEHFASYGHCFGSDSSTCQRHTCLLTSADCIAYSKKEKHDLARMTKQVLFKAVTTGKCDPSVSATGYTPICNKYGYCDFFENHGAEDGTIRCETLNDEERQEFVSRLRVLDEDSVDIVDSSSSSSSSSDGDGEGSKRSSPDEMQDKRDPHTVGKRSLADEQNTPLSQDTSQKRDVEEAVKSALTKRALIDRPLRYKTGFTDAMAKGDGSTSTTLDGAVDFFGEKLNQEQLAVKAFQVAAQVSEPIMTSRGYCDALSSTCDQNRICVLSTEGCRRYSSADKISIEQKFLKAYLDVLFTGLCQAMPDAQSDNCDASGHCQLWKSGDLQRDPSCRELTDGQHWNEFLDRFSAALVQPRQTDTHTVVQQQGGYFGLTPYADQGTPSSILSKRSLPHHSSDSIHDDAKAKPSVSSSSSNDGDTVDMSSVKMTQAQLADHVLNAAAQATALATKSSGHCKKESEICRNHVCLLRDPGCRPYTEEEAAVIEDKYIIAYSEVLFSGHCNPSAASKENDNCDTSGRCQLWLGNGKRDHACKQLGSRQFYYRLLAVLDDLGMGPGAHKAHGAGVYTHKAKRDVSLSTSAEVEQPDAAKFHGVKVTKKQVFALADAAASQAVALAFHNLGYCEENSATCHGESCDLGMAGCISYPEKVIDQYEQMLAKVYRHVFTSGTCDVEAAAGDGKSDSCDQSGHCTLWMHNDKRDLGCKELTSEQTQLRLQAELDVVLAQNMPEAEAGAEKRPLQKRNFDYGMFNPAVSNEDNRNTAKFHGVNLTLKEAYALADQTAEAATTHEFDKLGHCDPKSSSTCQESFCDVGKPGCIAYSDEAKRHFLIKFQSILRSVMTSGSCDPNDSEGNCEPTGRCQLWSDDGVRDRTCAEPSFTQLQIRLESAYDTMLALDELELDADKGRLHKRSKRHATDSDGEEPAPNTVLFNGLEMTQRQVAQQAILVAQQAIKYSTQDSGTCAKGSPTCRDEYCTLSSPGCIAYSDEQKLQLQQALSMLLTEVFTSGSCKATAGPAGGRTDVNCDASGMCLLWQDGGKRDYNCKPLKKKQLKARLQDALQTMYASGAADTDARDGSGSGLGSGSRSDKEKRNLHYTLVKRALDIGFKDVKSEPDSSNSDENKEKPEAALINGVPMTHKQVQKEAKRIASTFTEFGPETKITCAKDGRICVGGTCKDTPVRCEDLAKNQVSDLQETVAMVLQAAFSTGTCDQNVDNTGRLCKPAVEGGETCFLWKEDDKRDHGCKELTKKQLQTRLEADFNLFLGQFVPESKEPAARSSSAKRNSSRGLSKRELIDGPILQNLLERDMGMDEPGAKGSNPETRPGFITIRKSDLLSSSKLYQPTPEEVSEFMSVCKHLSHDHKALQHVAEAAGVYDEEDIEQLREHFGELAHNREAATEVLQEAKMQQMVRESKTTGGLFGAMTAPSKVAAAAGVDKLRKTGGELDVGVDSGSGKAAQ